MVKVYPTDANFILAKVTDADAVYDYLIKNGGDSEKPFTDAGMCRRVAYYGGHSGGESPHASTYKGVWEMNPLINDNRK